MARINNETRVSEVKLRHVHTYIRWMNEDTKGRLPASTGSPGLEVETVTARA